MLRTIIVALMLSTPAQADDVNEAFGIFGFTMETSISNGSCLVTGVTDKQTLLEKIPFLQKIGLINQDLTTADINIQPTTLAATFTVEMTTVATRETFEKNPNVNICSFVMNLKELDVYGQQANNKILSYTFDRVTFSKINWLNFEPQNMPKVAKKFSFDPVINARIMAEH